ncbi:MDR family NADPH-dependent oxidoreductase [Luteolibacter algae]|uniref:enoyl-[acyl-carrier-protein] reductase n=1 Tax=Luteolibacter algae TaxID=454151 RepID=A0ABW5D7D7_9BACT
MHSTRLIFKQHGNPADVLELEEFTVPPLEEGEVLLSINAAPVNPADLNYIEGTYGIKPSLPATAGIECFATILESRSPDFKPGESVIPLGKIGGWASHAVTTADNLVRLPAGLDPLQAAILKVNPATAWLLLNHFTTLNPGDWVTFNAANSGVGQCVIQLAASMGIKTLCFLRNEALISELAELGATAVFPDTHEGYTSARELLGKKRTKLAFNAVGGDSALRLIKLLAEGGTHITYGAMGRKPLTVPNGPLIFNDIILRGLWVTKWMDKAKKSELQQVYADLAKRLAEGSLKQNVDFCYTLDDFPQALERLDSAERKGKILFSNL